MKHLTKIMYSLVMVLLLGAVSNAQTDGNLLRNGDFKNGTDGWNLGRDLKLVADPDYPYVQTEEVSSYGYPKLTTEGQEFPIKGGATYIFSFWAQNLDANDFRGFIAVENSKGSRLYGNFRNIDYEKGEELYGWTHFVKEVTFPDDMDIVKGTEFSIKITGNKSYKKMTEFSIVEKVDENAPVAKAPENFAKAESSQRSVKLTWTAEEGKTYTVLVDNKEYTTSSGELSVYGLSPATEYNAVVYADDNAELRSEITFTTDSYIQAQEEDRVPFLSNVVDGQIDRTFVFDVKELSGAPITGLEVTYAGEIASIDNNVVTLPQHDNGKLVVKVMQGDLVTTITYNSVSLKK